MGYKLVPGALCLLSLAALVTGNTNIFVTAPNIIHVDEPINVKVFIENLVSNETTTVHVEIRNHDDDDQLHSQKTTTLTTGQTSNMVLDVVLRVNSSILGPALGDAAPTYVMLKATSVNFSQILLVLVDRRTGMMYLQTDKPIYAPQHTVHLYVFTLDKDRKADTKELAVYIKNPIGVLMMQTNTTSVMGMSHLEFIVPNPATYGNWSVEVTSGYMKKTLRFDVEEYVLPHYKVELKFPQLNEVITPRTQTVNGVVQARYSFKAPVEGKGHVIIWVKEGDEETRAAAPIAFLLNNGKATFDINISSITQSIHKNTTSLIDDEAQLRIEAEVVEKSSGVIEKARVALLDFAESPYIVSTERVPRTFPPGLYHYYQIGVSLRSGRPVEDVNVIVAQTSAGKTKQIHQRKTNKYGFATFVSLGQRNPIHLKVYVNNNDTRPLKEITLHRSLAAEHMIIERVHDNAIKPRQRMMVLGLVRSVETAFTLNYLMASGGQIVYSGQEEARGSRRSVTVPITHEMVPQVQILFWYTSTTGAVISASEFYDIEQVCERELKLTVQDDNRYKKPGDHINVDIKGPANGTVALMAVDEAVDYMRENNLLTKSKMFKGVRQRDTGCAHAGGGTPTQHFEHAGIAMLSSLTTVNSTPRTSLNCPTATTRQRRSIPVKKPHPKSVTGCCSAGTEWAMKRARKLNETTRNNQETIQEIDTKCRHYALIDRSYDGLPCKELIFRCCAKELYNTTGGGNTDSRTESINGGRVYAAIRASDLVPPRDDFRESFLIKTVKLDPLGRLEERAQLPDSITTWLLTGVSLSDGTGMCVAQPYKQVVRKATFIKMHMPYKAVVGEQIELKATIHNLGHNHERGVIKLNTTAGYFCNEKRKKTRLNHRYEITERTSKTFSWLITPYKAGVAQIEVLMDGRRTIDKVIKNLIIIPAGLRTTPSPVLIALNPADPNRSNYNNSNEGIRYSFQNNPSTNSQTLHVTFSPPANVIRDTHKAKLQLSAEAIADVVSTLKKQVTYYTKDDVAQYGEEMNGRLSPTVCAARYTSARITLPRNITAVIDQGVKAMMTFRTREGAFMSVRDSEPGIWLTASTVRTLSAARPFSPFLKNNPNGVCETVKWLLKQKRNDGTYMDWRGIPTAFLIRSYPDEQKIALTAYVLLALKESKCDQASDLKDTADYLAGKVQTARFPYTRAIIAYALAKTNHSDAGSALDHLLNSATRIQGHYPNKSYWKNPSPFTSTQQDIETTAYGVSAMVAMDRTEEAKPYMEWLMSKRRADGLFRTSQTTVVGLQALTDYSLNTTIAEVNMQCTITANNHAPSSLHANLEITNPNSIQEFIVPQTAAGHLELRCRGRGDARLSLQSEYYIEKPASATEAFNIKITSKDDCPGNWNGCEGQRRVREFSLEVCIRAGRFDVGESVVDIGIPTGYKPDKYISVKLPAADIDDWTKTTTDKSIIFHIPNVTRSDQLCITFNMKQVFTVNNIKQVPVNVYDRYNPDLSEVKFYKHRSTRNRNIDEDEDLCPECYAYHRGQCGAHRCKRPLFANMNELREKACSCIYDYVFEGKLMTPPWEEDGLRKIEMNITKIAKQGTEKLTPLWQSRIFAIPVACSICRNLEEGRKYFIMGKEDIEDAGGRKIYHISRTTYLVQKGGNRPKKQFDPKGNKKWKVHKLFLRKPRCLTQTN